MLATGAMEMWHRFARMRFGEELAILRPILTDQAVFGAAAHDTVFSRSSVRWSWIRVSLRDQLPPDQIPRPVRFKTKTRRRSVSALPRH